MGGGSGGGKWRQLYLNNNKKMWKSDTYKRKSKVTISVTSSSETQVKGKKEVKTDAVWSHTVLLSRRKKHWRKL